MNPFLKTLLLWLLMLALPLQGMAAVVQSACSPAQHASMMTDWNGGKHDHDHDAGMTPHFPHEAAASPMPDEHDDTAMSAKAEQSHPGKTGHGGCSACAMCCVGAVAPPSFSVWQPGHQGSELVVLTPATFTAGHIAAGIERPPKRFSA